MAFSVQLLKRSMSSIPNCNCYTKCCFILLWPLHVVAQRSHVVKCRSLHCFFYTVSIFKIQIMDQLIRFRALADSLTDSEFNCFMTQLFAEYNRRQMLLSSLFYFFQATLHNNDSDPVHTAIRVISAIIKARDDNAKAPSAGSITLPSLHPLEQSSVSNHNLNSSNGATEKKEVVLPLKLHNLPTVLIGEVASYLHFDSYHSLMKCARSLYLGCTSPITLRSIHRRIFLRNAIAHSDHLHRQHLKMTQFRYLTHFGIDVNAFMEMEALHQTPLSRHTTSLSLYHSNQNTMRRFLSTNTWDFGQITVLKVCKYTIEWGTGQDDVHQSYCQGFCDLLRRFSNIQYLELQGMDIQTLSVSAWMSLLIWNQSLNVTLIRHSTII